MLWQELFAWASNPATRQRTAGLPLLRTVWTLLLPSPSVRSAAPEPGTHGRIADGGGPETSLESRKR